ncbi:TolC family outer membrane protein [Sinimarinibacterium thermocellulolyticum]|uniref:TolC family outer membrane protein n=1 Tax=Sinimarinibacterium thermocellulolyticum TaxID=3170016 RepID=A0ABV2ADV5_9GAMM
MRVDTQGQGRVRAIHSRRWRSRAAVCVLLACAPTTFAQTGDGDLLAVCNDALQNNAGYRAARAEYQAARELLPQAQGKLLPQLGLRAQYDWLHEHITGDYFGVIGIDREDHFDQSSYGVRLTQALYRPDAVLAKQQAALRVQQAELKLRAAQDQLLLEVAEAYFTALAAEDALRFARAETLALREQLAQVRSREAAGLAIDAHVKAAQAQLQLALARETEAVDAIANALTRLEALAGRPYSRLRGLPPNLTLLPPQPADVEVWTARAERDNPWIRLQHLGVDLAALGHERARKAEWPVLDLLADAFRLDAGGGAAGERDEDQTRIGVVMTLPLYAGGQVEATKRQTLALQSQAAAELDDVRARVLRDTRIAYRNSASGLLRVEAHKRALDAAIAAEASTRGGFEAGTLSNTDLLTAIERRYEAERDHANARYRFLMASLRLKSLAGNLLVADLAQINRVLEAPGPP